MATTKKELERIIKKQKQEILRQDKIIERLRIQLSVIGIRGYRAAAKERVCFTLK